MRCKNDWEEALKSMLLDKNVSSSKTNHIYTRSLSFSRCHTWYLKLWVQFPFKCSLTVLLFWVYIHNSKANKGQGRLQFIKKMSKVSWVLETVRPMAFIWTDSSVGGTFVLVPCLTDGTYLVNKSLLILGMRGGRLVLFTSISAFSCHW